MSKKSRFSHQIDAPETEVVPGDEAEHVPASLEAFFAENMSQEGLEREIIVSKRFTDGSGNPVPWKIRALSDLERDEIQRACTKPKMTYQKGRQRQVQDFDAALFMNKLRTASVVFPDLDSKALQDSYGVQCAEDLLGVMLTAAEGTYLLEEVNSLGGLDDGELEDEAKN